MIDKNEITMMTNSYKKMYIIENLMRSSIKEHMKSIYGPNWYSTAPRTRKIKPNKRAFKELYFYELIPFFSLYPILSKIVPNDIVFKMQQLIPIRNKIAHHECLTRGEYKLLCIYFKSIVKHIVR